MAVVILAVPVSRCLLPEPYTCLSLELPYPFDANIKNKKMDDMNRVLCELEMDYPQMT